MEIDALYIGKCLFVHVSDMTMVSDVVMNNSHLTASNTGTNIRKTIVVTNFLMLIIRVSLTCLCSKEHHLPPFLFIWTNQCTTT